MDQSTIIPMTPPAMKSQDFSFLREEGMELLRDVAAQTWTDHNLHDPGITLLELLVAFLQAYVFALLTCIYLNDAIHLH